MKKLSFRWQTQYIFKSLLAGVLIALAGGTYLSCNSFITDPNIAKLVGSFLFSIGLIAVLVLEANLFTGKIGYVESWHKFGLACACLVYNVLAAFFIGLLYRGLHISDAIGPFAPGSARLLKSWYQMLFDGFGCGALIYLAVELYRRTKNFIPVIICVMAFILSGTEHSIADAFFLGASQFSWQAFGYLWLVILGNSFGAISIHWLQRGAEYLNELPANIDSHIHR